MQGDSVHAIGRIVQVNRWSSYAPGRVASLHQSSEGCGVTELDPSPRLLALRLGLGDLNAVPGCAGYAHGCSCGECRKREEYVNPKFLSWLESEMEPMPKYRLPPRRAAQPWQSKAA